MKRRDGWTCVFSAGDRCTEVHRGLLHFCLSPAVLLQILSSIMLHLTSPVWARVTISSSDSHIFPHWVTKPHLLGFGFNRYQVAYHRTELKFRYLFSSQVTVTSPTWLWCHLVSPWYQSSLDFSGAAYNPWLAVSWLWLSVPALCVSLVTKYRGKNWMAVLMFCEAVHLMHKYRSCWKIVRVGTAESRSSLPFSLLDCKENSQGVDISPSMTVQTEARREWCKAGDGYRADVPAGRDLPWLICVTVLF